MSHANDLGMNEDNSGKKNKHLIFTLANERYGIPLSKVKEVIGVPEVTPIPQVPKFFKGVINLRGRIISIIDLKNKLSMGTTEFTPKKTSIIITELEDTIIGCLIDEVSEVIGIDPDQIEQSVEMQSRVNKNFISGVAKTANYTDLIILIDVTKTLNPDELAMLRR